MMQAFSVLRFFIVYHACVEHLNQFIKLNARPPTFKRVHLQRQPVALKSEENETKVELR
jgi:hypothetical protein